MTKLIASVLLGAIASACVLWLLFVLFRMPTSIYRDGQYRQYIDLMRVQAALTEYKEKNQTFPATRDELVQFLRTPGATQQGEFQLPHPNGRFDPLSEYRGDGKSWTIVWYGRDNQPGGAGLDADWTLTDSDARLYPYAEPYRSISTPTLAQMAERNEFWSALALSLLTGVIVGVLFARKLRQETDAWRTAAEKTPAKTPDAPRIFATIAYALALTSLSVVVAVLYILVQLTPEQH